MAFIAYAMPDFLLYLIAIQIFALTFSIFGFEASQSTSLITVVGDWHDMALPIICLPLLILAGYSRYMRSSAMDVLAQDYIKTRGPRACRSGSCCSGTWSATPSCR